MIFIIPKRPGLKGWLDRRAIEGKQTALERAYIAAHRLAWPLLRKFCWHKWQYRTLAPSTKPTERICQKCCKQEFL